MQRRRRQSGRRASFTTTVAVAVFALALLTVLYKFLFTHNSSARWVIFGNGVKECSVVPRFLTPADYDRAEVKVKIPDHVREFDAKGVILPKYASSELLLISVSSNNTFQRQIAQNYTFGRIFEIQFVTDLDFPRCVLCKNSSVDDACHCPVFRTPCHQHIFHDRPLGWWCATRKALAAIELILNRWEEKELPKWVHLLDDNTWINPISEMLIIENLNPDDLHFIGDDWGDFLAGGPGQLMSRGTIKKLMGPPLDSTVTYHWPNGTHSITVQSQLQSCLSRMQGGDWCFFHNDWALTACLLEVGVTLTDLGSPTHDAFFTQVDKVFVKNGTWFNVGASLAPLLHHTHSAALHISTNEMFDVFYHRIVPHYQNLRRAWSTQEGQKSEAGA